MSTDFSQRTRTIRRSERGFLRDVSEQVRPSELLLLAVVPVVLVAVALLPESTRGALAFDTADPEVVAAFTAHYVHFNEVHLYGNLVIYAVVATLAYLLAILSGRRQVFVAGFLTLLVVFPFALSGMQLAFPRERAVLGFSGLNAALFGLLSLLVVSYARAVFSDHLEEQYAPALLFIRSGSSPSSRFLPEPGGSNSRWCRCSSASDTSVYWSLASASRRCRPSGRHSTGRGISSCSVRASVPSSPIRSLAFRKPWCSVTPSRTSTSTCSGTRPRSSSRSCSWSSSTLSSEWWCRFSISSRRASILDWFRLWPT